MLQRQRIEMQVQHCMKNKLRAKYMLKMCNAQATLLVQLIVTTIQVKEKIKVVILNVLFKAQRNFCH